MRVDGNVGGGIDGTGGGDPPGTSAGVVSARAGTPVRRDGVRPRVPRQDPTG